MSALRSFNLQQWIDSHRQLLRPPVGNKLVFEDTEFIIMVVGGPNARRDFHVDPAEEFFYQLEGDMSLRVVEQGQIRELPIRELDGLQWYCENCGQLLYEEYFALTDIERQFPPVFDRFFGSLSARTCKHCHTVMAAPAPSGDRA